MTNLILAVLYFLSPPQDIQRSAKQVVEVMRYDHAVCTGWAINTPGTKNTYIMTAKHCRDDKTPLDDGLPTSIRTSTNKTIDVKSVISSPEKDFMLLETVSFGVPGFNLSTSSPVAGGVYFTISHPIDEEWLYMPMVSANVFKNFVKPDVTNDGEYDQVYVCPGCTHGSSGAPVIGEDGVKAIVLAVSVPNPPLTFTTSSSEILKFMQEAKKFLQ